MLPQEEKPKVKVITVLDQRRANNILIEISRLPAPRHIKTAILNMDHTHFTKEVVEVCAHTHTHRAWVAFITVCICVRACVRACVCVCLCVCDGTTWW